MVYQLCSPASARPKQEAGRLLCGTRRVKVAWEVAPRNADQKPPFLSRLESELGHCFVGVARNPNRGVSIRKVVASEFLNCDSPTQKIAKYLRLGNFSSLILVGFTFISNSRFAIRKWVGQMQDRSGTDARACPRLPRVRPVRSLSQFVGTQKISQLTLTEMQTSLNK